MNPLAVALGGKGPYNLLRRSTSILRRYGVTTSRLAQELESFAELARRYDARPTFPITSVVMERHPHLIRKLHDRGVEFAIHGHYHIDHLTLSPAVQRRQLALAQRNFRQAGISVRGFRAPYLRFNAQTLSALRELSLDYDASQGIYWEMPGGGEAPAYRRALSFYRALPAATQLSLPTMTEGVVRIPYSLPDDEALTERLSFDTAAARSKVWLAILQQTIYLGELFTVGLHPERTTLFIEPLRAVLEMASLSSPPVWLACLAEIAQWWRERAAIKLQLESLGNRRYRAVVTGSDRATILLRNATLALPERRWAEGYCRVTDTTFEFEAPVRPVVAIAPGTDDTVADFLSEQGYLIEIGAKRTDCAFFVERRASFSPAEQRPLLVSIEAGAEALVKVGRWPDGAHSALALTGDIDALTLWDYGLRFLGK
jgi:peptidoglycan/xylan/chitin deacetylase (PgdA/CDA1 family)